MQNQTSIQNYPKDSLAPNLIKESQISREVPFSRSLLISGTDSVSKTL